MTANNKILWRTLRNAGIEPRKLPGIDRFIPKRQGVTLNEFVSLPIEHLLPETRWSLERTKLKIVFDNYGGVSPGHRMRIHSFMLEKAARDLNISKQWLDKIGYSQLVESFLDGRLAEDTFQKKTGDIANQACEGLRSLDPRIYFLDAFRYIDARYSFFDSVDLTYLSMDGKLKYFSVSDEASEKYYRKNINPLYEAAWVYAGKLITENYE